MWINFLSFKSRFPSLHPCPAKAKYHRLSATPFKLHSTDASVTSGLGMIKKWKKEPGSFKIGVGLKLA